MPIVVPGLSSGASKSRTAPPCTTFSSQDSTRDNSTQGPLKEKTKTGPKLSPGHLEHTLDFKRE